MNDKGKTAVVALLLAVFVVVLTVVNERVAPTSAQGIRNTDFMSLWGGGRAILSGVNPYAPGMWAEWRTFLGSEWIPDQQAPFPLWTLLVMMPFSAMPITWGVAAWQAVSQVMLGISLWLIVQTMSPRSLRPLAFGFVLLTAFVLRGVILTLSIGQITLVLLFILVSYLYLSHEEHYFGAGLVLSLVLLKPNPFVFFIPVFGLWLLAQQRWRTIAGGFAGAVTMFVVSWLVIPGWIFEWLNVRGKTEYSFINPTVWGLSFELSPTWWPLLGLGLTLLLSVGAGWLFLTNKGVTEWQAVSLALTISLFTSPYAWAYEHALLLLPIAFLLTKVERRWLAWSLWFFLTFVWPWFLFWVARQRLLDTYSALVPLLVGGVVLWVMWQQARLQARAPEPEPTVSG